MASTRPLPAWGDAPSSPRVVLREIQELSRNSIAAAIDAFDAAVSVRLMEEIADGAELQVECDSRGTFDVFRDATADLADTLNSLLKEAKPVVPAFMSHVQRYVECALADLAVECPYPGDLRQGDFTGTRERYQQSVAAVHDAAGAVIPMTVESSFKQMVSMWMAAVVGHAFRNSRRRWERAASQAVADLHKACTAASDTKAHDSTSSA